MSEVALIKSGLGELGLLDDEGLAVELDKFLTLLLKWNQTYNLTAIREAEKIVSHHLLDSLSIQGYLRGDSLLDVGSGGGFPGIPLALNDPDLRVTLLDSNGKKTRFLQQAKISLGLENCSVEQSRSEDFEGCFDQITCRAFASLADIIAKTSHLLSADGEILALKGRIETQEIEVDLGEFEITNIHNLKVPQLNAERHVIVIKRKSNLK